MEKKPLTTFSIYELWQEDVVLTVSWMKVHLSYGKNEQSALYILLI